MAYWVAKQTGASNSASTWGSVLNTPTLHASTTLQLTTTPFYTPVFTAPNLVDQFIGLVLSLTSQPVSTGVCSFVLQEYDGVSAWVDVQTATINNSDLLLCYTANYATGFTGSLFRVAFAGYTFTTTTAGYYRVKCSSSVASARVSADTTGLVASCLLQTNATGTPALGDYCYVLGDSITTPLTVTVTGTANTSGNGTTSNVWNYALYVASGGVLDSDTTADSTWTHRGTVLFTNGSTWNIASSGSRLNSAYTAKFVPDHNGVANTANVVTSGSCAINHYGYLFENDTVYVSGTGTTASPIVVPSDWAVDDYFVIGAGTNSATNYNEVEKRFIISKPSATTAVVSTTQGGAEAGLTYTKVAGVRMTRFKANIHFFSTSATTLGLFTPTSNAANNINMSGVMFRNLGTSGLLFSLSNTANLDHIYITDSTTGVTVASNCAPFNISSYHTYATDGGASGALDILNSQTVVDGFYIYRSRRYTLRPGGSSNTFKNGYINGGNYAPFASAGGITSEGNNNSFQNIYIDACGLNAIIPFGSKNRFNTVVTGAYAKNSTIAIQPATGTFCDATFTNCTFNETNAISNYLNMSPGSEIRFHNFQNTADSHRWYTRYGYAIKAGDATTGKVRIFPEELTTGFTLSYLESVKVGNYMSTSGKIQKNAGMASKSVVVSIYLPDSLTVADTKTMETDTSENTYGLTKSFSGSYPLYGVVEIVAKSNTAGDYLEVYQVDGGTNTITNFQVWYDGKPSIIQFPLLGDAQSNWNVLLSALTLDGSIGKLAAKAFKYIAKFIS